MSTVARPVREIIGDFLEKGPYAVVGASNDRAKYGNKVLRAYKSKGWKVYPVNPREKEVEGLTAYPDLASVPGAVECAVIAVPANLAIEAMEACVAKGVKGVVMFTAGFAEIGEEGRAMQQRITPPPVTERVVVEAAEAGARFVWMQPGAESPEAIRIARERGLEVIGDGSCFLVETRFRG